MKVGLRLHPDMHKWIMERTGPGKRFATLTHAVESGIACLQREEGEGGSGGGAKERKGER